MYGAGAPAAGSVYKNMNNADPSTGVISPGGMGMPPGMGPGMGGMGPGMGGMGPGMGGMPPAGMNGPGMGYPAYSASGYPAYGGMSGAMSPGMGGMSPGMGGMSPGMSPSYPGMNPYAAGGMYGQPYGGMGYALAPQYYMPGAGVSEYTLHSQLNSLYI